MKKCESNDTNKCRHWKLFSKDIHRQRYQQQHSTDMLQRLFIRIDWMNTSNDRHNHYQQNKRQFRFIYHFAILFYTISVRDKGRYFFEELAIIYCHLSK